jgi:uncharacterized membrane protein
MRYFVPLPNIIKGVYMSNRLGYLASIALFFLAIIGLTQGFYDALEFICLVLFGTISGCYFVYQEFIQG